MTKFDPTKPVQTRDGRKARILCTDRVCKYPIVALVTRSGSNIEDVLGFTNEGFWNVKECPDDLINIPEKKTGYIAITKGGDVCTFCGKPFKSKGDLFSHISKYKILKVIEVEWEE